MEHPHRDILVAIAEGKHVQFKGALGGWATENAAHLLRCIANGGPCESFRVKPETITIGEHLINAPMRVAPADGAQFWAPNVVGKHAAFHKWDGALWNLALLDAGYCFATESDATACAIALHSLTAL